MSAQSFEELLEHVGHDIVCVSYRKGGGVALDKGALDEVGALYPPNVAVECMDCHVVLLDFDRPES